MKDLRNFMTYFKHQNMTFIIQSPSDLCKHLKEFKGGMKLTMKLVAYRRKLARLVGCRAENLQGIVLDFEDLEEEHKCRGVSERDLLMCLFWDALGRKLGRRKQRKQLILVAYLSP